jgi:endonuclease YncB( thermonuclease family)
LTPDTEHKIRLAGVDAPEKGQPFGQKSKQTLADMVAGQSVFVEWYKRDRYGRIVGKVLSENQDVNLVMVRFGMAWWYRKYAHEQSDEDQRFYEQAETEARREKRGLWIDQRPMAPWDWRDYRRTHKAP